MTKKVFITGITGYLGGETLARLLSSSLTKSYSYSALVRNKDKVPLIESLGVRPVLGTLDDAALLSTEAERADVVIHIAASSDHVPSCEAILEGMKKRDDSPILIHISGTGVLMDDAHGEYAAEIIYSDLDVDPIHALPDSAWHRNVENLVFAASPSIRTHIVSPCSMYGVADNALVKMGLSKPTSTLTSLLVHTAVRRGQIGITGKGMNIWSSLHVTEFADAIVALLVAAVAGKTATGREGYYFAESGEFSMYDISVHIGRALSARGIGTSEPTSFTAEEVKEYLGGLLTGANFRCKAHRLRQLGWQPNHFSKDFWEAINSEIDFALKGDVQQK